MKQIWVDRTTKEELPEVFEWLKRIADRNLIDWDVLTYPATSLLKATDGEKNVLHVPVQSVYMVESLGISPDASPLEMAKALSGVFGIVRWESKRAGQGEVYFLCRDEETVRFAEHHEMERVNIPLFRFKVGKI